MRFNVKVYRTTVVATVVTVDAANDLDASDIGEALAQTGYHEWTVVSDDYAMEDVNQLS